MPTLHGPLSGRRKENKTFVPTRDGITVSKRQEADREMAERAKGNFEKGWMSAAGSSLTENEKAKLQEQVRQSTQFSPY